MKNLVRIKSTNIDVIELALFFRCEAARRGGSCDGSISAVSQLIAASLAETTE